MAYSAEHGSEADAEPDLQKLDYRLEATAAAPDPKH